MDHTPPPLGHYKSQVSTINKTHCLDYYSSSFFDFSETESLKLKFLIFSNFNLLNNIIWLKHDGRGQKKEKKITMVKGIFRSRGWAYTISARDHDVLLGGYNFIKKMYVCTG
jgi:hypothetical protein